MLNADMNARYWKRLVGKYSKRDRILKIFTALMASGTVASWGLWADLSWLWKSLSGLSAVVAISMPILNYQKLIEEMSALAGKWGELKIEYEDLWLQVKSSAEPDQLDESYRDFRRIGASLQLKEAALPDDQTLLVQCFEAVKKARGI
jgi:hypothetical protein